MREHFRAFATLAARAAGSPYAFVGALLLVLLWAATGPLFHYSDTWELMINTGTTIITFLMLFVLQNAQNRDAAAIHIKLDELLRAVHDARNTMMRIEDLSEEELDRLREQLKADAEKPC